MPAGRSVHGRLCSAERELRRNAEIRQCTWDELKAVKARMADLPTTSLLPVPLTPGSQEPVPLAPGSQEPALFSPLHAVHGSESGHVGSDPPPRAAHGSNDVPLVTLPSATSSSAPCQPDSTSMSPAPCTPTPRRTGRRTASGTPRPRRRRTRLPEEPMPLDDYEDRVLALLAAGRPLSECLSLGPCATTTVPPSNVARTDLATIQTEPSLA